MIDACAQRNKGSCMHDPRSGHRHCSLLVAAVLTLAACARGNAPVSPARAPNALEGALDIVAWPGYVERGASDSKYDWVRPFEQDTGCKITVRTAGTSDEMVSLRAQGGYDLVTASGVALLRLVGGGTVHPVALATRALLDRLPPAAFAVAGAALPIAGPGDDVEG